MTPSRLLIGIEDGLTLVTSMFPPDFASKSGLIISGTLQSIKMSVIATIVGIVLGVPIAFLAAENLVPRTVYLINRSVILFARAFHSLIVAIIVVKAVGFGPVAGIITLVIKTIGFFSRLLADELEDIDDGMLEAVRATGASRLQVFTYAVLPQAMPRVVGLSIYQWDINIRQSTVIGIVGAGGIGITLMNSFKLYDYDLSMAIILVIIGLVLIGEGVSKVARERVT
jgi:phosphonate transport system permease protein